jgi:NADH:ubiquinone oxidoreductase subunit 6 (subunit J)
MENKITPAWQKGLLISLVLILIGLIIYFAGQAQNKALGWIQFCVMIGAIIWACTSYAKQMQGNVTFGNVFAHGFKVAAAIAAITAVYTFIAFKFIYPEMIDASVEEARKNMEAKGNMTDDQIKQGLDIMKKFFVPIAIGGLLLMTAILGVVASLIGAAVAKKNPNPIPEQ